jgi:hypothetical protein
MMAERRESARLFLTAEVEITGIGDDGLQFAERSALKDIGDAGCSFTLRNKVQRGAVVGVEPLGPDGAKSPEEYARLFLVIWVKWQDRRWRVGARCLLGDELAGSGLASRGSSSRNLKS